MLRDRIIATIIRNLLCRFSSSGSSILRHWHFKLGTLALGSNKTDKIFALFSGAGFHCFFFFSFPLEPADDARENFSH